MKKLIAAVMILICGAVYINYKRNDIVRIHIVADNDSEFAQNEKLLVRDKVNEFIAPLLCSCKTKAQAEKVLNENLDGIEEIANEFSSYGAVAKIEEKDFPEKTYNSKTYPAGKYTALTVYLGEAKGHNWWCVAFPPMCYTTADSNNNFSVQYKFGIIEWLKGLL